MTIIEFITDFHWGGRWRSKGHVVVCASVAEAEALVRTGSAKETDVLELLDVVSTGKQDCARAARMALTEIAWFAEDVYSRRADDYVATDVWK